MHEPDMSIKIYSEFQVSKYVTDWNALCCVISIDDTGLAHENYANLCQNSQLYELAKYVRSQKIFFSRFVINEKKLFFSSLSIR